ncbi:MAG: thioredoxin family protein, partial [Myxococcaceae bacterium]
QRPLPGYPGAFVVYDFWAPWCDACRSVDVRLRELAARDSRVLLRRVNIVDFDSKIARAALPGVEVLPHVRVIDPDGATVLDLSGPADQVVDAVNAAVKP